MLTLLKKNKNSCQQFTSDAFPAGTADEDSLKFKGESINLLYSAIKQLSEIDRAVILLYLEENSY